jgi:hypothetical protein
MGAPFLLQSGRLEAIAKFGAVGQRRCSNQKGTVIAAFYVDSIWIVGLIGQVFAPDSDREGIFLPGDACIAGPEARTAVLDRSQSERCGIATVVTESIVVVMTGVGGINMQADVATGEESNIPVHA